MFVYINWRMSIGWINVNVFALQDEELKKHQTI